MSAPIVLAAGGVALLALTEGMDPPPAGPQAEPPRALIAGKIAPLALRPPALKLPTWMSPAAGGGNKTAASATATKQLELAEARARAEYTKLSATAKKKAAAELSDKLNLSPPLTGDESWEQLTKKAGSAIGVAACGAIPGGAIATPLCAIVGAYFGAKLADWMADAWDSIASAADKAIDKTKDAANAAISFVGGLF